MFHNDQSCHSTIHHDRSTHYLHLPYNGLQPAPQCMNVFPQKPFFEQHSPNQKPRHV
jgi:hypothetical protein